MLDGEALRTLSGWCSRRGSQWTHGPANVLLLEPNPGRRGRVLLVSGGGDLSLQDERGETLASASDLPALLDALDGGLGEPPVRPGEY